jgi:hypothetical protein
MCPPAFAASGRSIARDLPGAIVVQQPRSAHRPDALPVIRYNPAYRRLAA